jgi:hypothetical protein
MEGHRCVIDELGAAIQFLRDSHRSIWLQAETIERKALCLCGSEDEHCSISAHSAAIESRVGGQIWRETLYISSLPGETYIVTSLVAAMIIKVIDKAAIRREIA